MQRAERGQVKDLNPPNAEEAEGFDGEKEIPENLAELLAAARKRLADSEIGE